MKTALIFQWVVLAVNVALLVAIVTMRAEPETLTQVVVRPFPVEVEVEPEPEPTPIADSLIDWDEQERQNLCLWTFLQESGVELTFENVIAAGDWTDALGGACAVIGED